MSARPSRLRARRTARLCESDSATKDDGGLTTTGRGMSARMDSTGVSAGTIISLGTYRPSSLARRVLAILSKAISNARSPSEYTPPNLLSSS